MITNIAHSRRGNDSRCCVTVWDGRLPLFWEQLHWNVRNFAEFIEQNEDPEQSRDSDCWKSASQALTQEFQGSADSYKQIYNCIQMQYRTMSRWQVYGYIRAINKDRPTMVEVLVDSWPEFKVIICRLKNEVSSGGEL